MEHVLAIAWKSSIFHVLYFIIFVYTSQKFLITLSAIILKSNRLQAEVRSEFLISFFNICLVIRAS